MTAGLNSPNRNQFSAMLQRAWKQHQASQLQAAEDAYLQLLVASPGDPDTNNLIGLLFIQTGRPAIAEVIQLVRDKIGPVAGLGYPKVK